MYIMAMKWRKVGTARPELGTLINAAFFSGEITILQIGKTDKAAIVPLSLVREYQELMARQPDYTDNTGAPLARDDILPREVTEHALAHSRRAELAAAFEQPPIEPSQREQTQDEILADLFAGQEDEDAG
jgi:hypothetical protein